MKLCGKHMENPTQNVKVAYISFWTGKAPKNMKYDYKIVMELITVLVIIIKMIFFIEYI